MCSLPFDRRGLKIVYNVLVLESLQYTVNLISHDKR